MNNLNSSIISEFQEGEGDNYCLLQNVVYIPSQEQQLEQQQQQQHLIIQPEAIQQTALFPQSLEINPENEMRLDTQIDDDPLAMLLKSWNSFDELYTFLALKGITIEGLKYVKTRHLDEIFGGEKTNEKIILEHMVSCWLNEQGIYNLLSQQEARDCRETFQTERLTTDGSSDEGRNFKQPYGVHGILMSTEQGKGICKIYKDTKTLSPQARTYIVHNVIENIIENGHKLCVKNCEDLADEIVSIFPTECRKSDKNNVSKELKFFGDRYQGRKRVASKLLNNSKRLKQHTETTITTNTIPNVNYEEVCADLKHIRDWETVLIKWKETVSYRANRLLTLDLTLDKILDEWPLYKYSKAPELVDIDYRHSFPENELNFSKWDNLCSISSNIFDTRIKDPQSKLLKKRVFEQRGVLNIDNFNIYVIMLLHSILLPSGKVVNGRRTKFTITDSQNAFTVKVRQPSEVDAVIAEKRRNCLVDSSTLQPFVIVVGDEFNFKDFYVTLDGIKYAFNSYTANLFTKI